MIEGIKTKGEYNKINILLKMILHKTKEHDLKGEYQ